MPTAKRRHSINAWKEFEKKLVKYIGPDQPIDLVYAVRDMMSRAASGNGLANSYVREIGKKYFISEENQERLLELKEKWDKFSKEFGMVKAKYEDVKRLDKTKWGIKEMKDVRNESAAIKEVLGKQFNTISKGKVAGLREFQSQVRDKLSVEVLEVSNKAKMARNTAINSLNLPQEVEDLLKENGQVDKDNAKIIADAYQNLAKKPHPNKNKVEAKFIKLAAKAKVELSKFEFEVMWKVQQQRLSNNARANIEKISNNIKKENRPAEDVKHRDYRVLRANLREMRKILQSNNKNRRVDFTNKMNDFKNLSDAVNNIHKLDIPHLKALFNTRSTKNAKRLRDKVEEKFERRLQKAEKVKLMNITDIKAWRKADASTQTPKNPVRPLGAVEREAMAKKITERLSEFDIPTDSKDKDLQKKYEKLQEKLVQFQREFENWKIDNTGEVNDWRLKKIPVDGFAAQLYDLHAQLEALNEKEQKIAAKENATPEPLISKMTKEEILEVVREKAQEVKALLGSLQALNTTELTSNILARSGLERDATVFLTLANAWVREHESKNKTDEKVLADFAKISNKSDFTGFGVVHLLIRMQSMQTVLQEHAAKKAQKSAAAAKSQVATPVVDAKEVQRKTEEAAAEKAAAKKTAEENAKAMIAFRAVSADRVMALKGQVAAMAKLLDNDDGDASFIEKASEHVLRMRSLLIEMVKNNQGASLETLKKKDSEFEKACVAAAGSIQELQKKMMEDQTPKMERKTRLKQEALNHTVSETPEIDIQALLPPSLQQEGQALIDNVIAHFNEVKSEINDSINLILAGGMVDQLKHSLVRLVKQYKDSTPEDKAKGLENFKAECDSVMASLNKFKQAVGNAQRPQQSVSGQAPGTTASILSTVMSQKEIAAANSSTPDALVTETKIAREPKPVVSKPVEPETSADNKDDQDKEPPISPNL